MERYLTYLAPELARRGHTVTIVGGEPVAMTEALTGTGVEHIPAATTIQVLRGAVAGPRPDLLHSHMTAADAAALVASTRLGRPSVSTLHFAGGRGHSRVTRAAYGRLRGRFAREIAISSHVAATSGGDPVVLPTGIPDRPRPGGPRRPVVLVAQRLEAEKQTDLAIRAWSASGLAAVGWELVVAGRGSQADALQRLVDGLGATESVRFVGHQADLTPRLAEASMLLAPTPDEAFGLTVVEAMASGLAVVAAAAGGHLETVGPVASDWMFAPGDPVAAAGRLRALADSPEDREALGRRLRGRFEAEYTIEHHVDRLEALYRDVTSIDQPETDQPTTERPGRS